MFAATSLLQINGRRCTITGEKCGLSGKDLRGLNQLKLNDLAGTDLTCAKLPKHISYSQLLDSLREISTSLQRQSFIIDTACIYVWIVVGSIKDENLIVKRGSIKIPIVGAEVKTDGFFLFTTLIISLLISYHSIQMLIYGNLKKKLPLRFQDGLLAEEKVHQTVFNYGIFYNSRKKEFNDCWRYIFYFAALIRSIFPVMILSIMMYRYYCSDNSEILAPMLIIGLSSIAFYMIVYAAGEEITMPYRKEKSPYERFLFSPFAAVFTTFLVMGLFYLSFLFVEKVRNPGGTALQLNLRSAQLSEKLTGWGPQNRDAVKGADLRSKRLVNADAHRAFLAGADLEGANLSRSDFTEADFRSARIVGVLLIHTVLDGSDLSNADLSDSKLHGASLKGTILNHTDLTSASYMTHRQVAQACGSSDTKLPIPPVETWEKLGDFWLPDCEDPNEEVTA